MKDTCNQLLIHLQNWENNWTISSTTVSDHYSFCREICEVIASHAEEQPGGRGLGIQHDEAFLIRRERNRGHHMHSHNIDFFVIYCHETKEGLYFRINGKSKYDLWPLLSKYLHPEIKHICTDQAKQYKKVKTLFSTSSQYTAVNHSKGHFVEKNDKENCINSTENSKKHLKNFFKFRLSDKLIYQYITVHLCFNRYIKKHMTLGPQLQQFTDDVIRFCPGPLEFGIDGLQLNEIIIPTTESEGIKNLMPIPWTLKWREQKPLSDTEDDIQNVDDPASVRTWWLLSFHLFVTQLLHVISKNKPFMQF